MDTWEKGIIDAWEEFKRHHPYTEPEDLLLTDLMDFLAAKSHHNKKI